MISELLFDYFILGFISRTGPTEKVVVIHEHILDVVGRVLY